MEQLVMEIERYRLSVLTVSEKLVQGAQDTVCIEKRRKRAAAGVSLALAPCALVALRD